MAKRRKKGALQKRAARDVRLAFRPEMREIGRAKDEAKDDYAESEQRVNDIYNTLAQNLAPLNGQYDTQAQEIMGDLTGSLGDLAPMMQMNNAMTGGVAEGQAAAGAYAGIGAGGLNLLSSDRLRNLSYQTSTQRQGELERAQLRKNYLEDMRDVVSDLNERRLDVKGDMSSAIIQRLDELRDQRYSRGMQERELDIAETQFNKNFNLDKRSQNASTKFAQQQIQSVRDAKEKKGDRRRVAPLKEEIGVLKTDIASMKQEGGTVGAAMAGELAQKTRQLRRKRKRVKKIRRQDNPNY